jgi:DNA helicase IV
MPISGVVMKQIDIMFTDHLVKINAQSIKHFVAVDTLYEIDHKNPKTRAQLLDGRLDIYVIKKVAGRSWPTLEVQDLTKPELMKRRNESVDRFYKEE